MDEKIGKLEKKLEALEIRRILVVDDKLENLKAAEEFFKKIKGVKFEYSNSAANAIKKIKENYKKNSYDMVLTDLEMEKKDSGVEVSKEAFTHQAYPLIITSRDLGGHHGYSTTIRPLNLRNRDASVNSPKTDPFTWRYILDYIIHNFNKYLYKALKKVKRTVGMPIGDSWETQKLFYIQK